MNIFLCIIVTALLLEFFLYNLSRLLDLKNLSTQLPDEFHNYYNDEEYARSQKYLRENTRFAYLTSSIDLLVVLLAIFGGVFNFLDMSIRGLGFLPIFNGLIFFGVLFLIQDIIGTPFSLYNILSQSGFEILAEYEPSTYTNDIKHLGVIE